MVRLKPGAYPLYAMGCAVLPASATIGDGSGLVVIDRNR
jgi:hypothetical protein